MIKKLLILMGTVLIMGCQPSIDGSNQNSFEKSLAKINESLSPEEQRQFGKDIVAASSLKILNIAHTVDPQLNAELQAKVRAELNGKTLEEVRAMATDYRERQKIAAREQTTAELKALEQLALKAEGEKALVNSIAIAAKSLSIKEDQFRTPVYALVLSVNNGTQLPIHSVNFRGSLGTREAYPMGYDFDVPLKPGEVRNVEMGNELLGHWVSKYGYVEAEANPAQVKIEVTDINTGPNGAVFSSQPTYFGTHEKGELGRLRSSLSNGHQGTVSN